jgi:hypothetical protein
MDLTQFVCKLGIGGALLVCGTAAASPNSHLVADTSTPIHGLNGTLDQFGVPAFNGAVVAFTAHRGTVGGVYADDFSGTPEVQKLAEVNDATPDGKTFNQLYNPATEGSGGPSVAFLAATCCSSPLYSLYDYSGLGMLIAPDYCGDGGVDSMVLAASTATCLIGTGDIASFFGGGPSGVRITSSQANGATGTVSFLPELTFSPVAGIAARASWTTGPTGEQASGILLAPPGSQVATVIVDTSTAIPNSSEKFMAFGQPALDGLGNIAFAGQGPTRSGVYLLRGGTLEVVADTSMTDPVTRGKFTELGAPVLDEGKVLFLGGEGVLSTSLFRYDGHVLAALYSADADVQFDNGTTRTISIGGSSFRPMAIANHRLAMRTTFPHETGSEGIILLDVGIAGTTPGGEPPHDGGTTNPVTGGPSPEGCSHPSKALAPLGLWMAWLARSRRRAMRPEDARPTGRVD